MKTTGTKKQDGLRKQFREYLDPDRFKYPRKPRLQHSTKWYYDGRKTKRPLYGVIALAKITELWLYYARHDTGAFSGAVKLIDASRTYSKVRSAMQNILSTYHAGERLPKEAVEKVRKTYLELCEDAAQTSRLFESERCSCPLCVHGKLPVVELDLLRAVLRKAADAGEIPQNSKLFNIAYLTTRSVI